MTKLRAILHILLHGNCIDPEDFQRTCAGCWHRLDTREPHISRYQDSERFHFGCEPWFTATEEDLAHADPVNAVRMP